MMYQDEDFLFIGSREPYAVIAGPQEVYHVPGFVQTRNTRSVSHLFVRMDVQRLRCQAVR
jgi:hypothetical protein